MRTKQNGERGCLGGSGLFRSERRREQILDVVEERELPLSVAELADAVTDDSEPATPKAGDWDQVRLQLHHVDLPKLQHRGVLEYDASRNVVSGVDDE